MGYQLALSLKHRHPSKLLTSPTGRLVRLIPSGSKENADASLSATKALFNHRLSSDANAARAEWLDIVDGRHELWASISSEKRELIRSFFNLVNMEIVKRARPSSTFDFGNAAVGNLFLTRCVTLSCPPAERLGNPD